MDDQRHAATLTDEAAGDEIARDIARALAVDPSPEFVARVRTQIANEPERGLFAALKGCATSGMWRRALALRLVVGGALAAAAIVLAAVLARPNRAPTPVENATLVARSLGEAVVVPYVGSGFLTAEASAKAVSRTSGQYGVSAFRRTTASPAKAGRPILSLPLLDPRETQALRALLAGVRTNRVDLSPLLRPGAPAPMELPPVDDLVIAPLAIEPLASVAGAQGERQ
jgi:hypothetical protein